MRPEVVDLGKQLAEHMINEDMISSTILELVINVEEYTFLVRCIGK